MRIQRVEDLGPCLVLHPLELLLIVGLILLLWIAYMQTQFDTLREALETFGTHNAHCACAPPTKTRTPYVAPPDAW